MKKILITGGLGFIGQMLSKQLLSTGYAVLATDNLSSQIHGEIPKCDLSIFENKNFHFLRADINNSQKYTDYLSDVDAIIHLAAETGTAQSMYQIAHYNQINTQATAQMMDFLANHKHKVKKIILSSSRSIYGEGAYFCAEHGNVYPKARLAKQLQSHQWNPVCPTCNAVVQSIPTPENTPPSPASIYAATKYAQEDLIKIAGDALGIGTTVLRFQNVYGAGQSLNNPYTGILSIFSTRIRRGLSLPIFEDGEESRDFVHVSDIVQAITLALRSDTANGKTFNVGSGEPTSVMQVAKQLVEVFGGTIQPHITEQYRLGDIRHCYADLTQIKSELGYAPKVSLQQGLNEFAQWVLSQDLPEDGLEKANDELKKRKMMS